MNEDQREAKRQKERLLSEGGYAITPHTLYREVMPELKAKYNAQTAQACVLMYGYLQAYVNGESDKSTYMWAFPTQVQIEQDTGIKRNRHVRITEILASEGLIKTRKEYRSGREKLYYLPLYYRHVPD